jgi:hypothetical protein
MKPNLLAGALTLVASVAFADNVENSDRLLCSTARVVICFEHGECIEMPAWEVNIPQFLIVDEKKLTLSTTKASDENRVTPIRTLRREDGLIIFQGSEQGRAFSAVIDEATGILTAAVSRDGATVSVFGNCTDAEIK